MKSLAGCIISILLLSGCSMRVADLTVASTKNVNLNSEANDTYKLSGATRFIKGARVKGEDYTPVFFIPLGMPDVEEAADRAIEQDKCAVALSDVVIHQNTYAFLFGAVGFVVEGDLVIDRMLPGCLRRK
jgi:hypothetical protein